MKFEASIIIPTFNGANKLTTTLNSLQKQSEGNFEIIVVVDGSTDNTLEVLSSFGTKAQNFKIVIEQNGGRAYARNRGAEKATGEILIFIDDDIEIMNDNIQNHINFHKSHVDATLVGATRLNQVQVAADHFQLYRERSEQKLGQRFNEKITRVSFDNYIFTTSNMSVARTLFVEMGMFDERLRDSEDLDLSVRLLLSGKAIYFDPGLICFHNDFADIRQTIKRQFQYYESKIHLLELHPEYLPYLKNQFRWLRKNYRDIIKGILFSNFLPWVSFFKTSFFKSLPQGFSDAAYSAMIYVNSALKIKNRRHAFKF